MSAAASLRKNILAVAAALSLAASGASPAESRSGAAAELLLLLSSRGPPPAVASRLDVDAHSGRRLVTLNKCQAEGEAELMRLAREGPTEEAFAFLPLDCIWIDVGVNQTRETVRMERALIRRIVEYAGVAVLYHTHTKSETGGFSFPAYTDMLSMLVLNGPYMNDPRIDVRHRAVSASGVIEYRYEPSEAGLRIIERIISTGLGGFMGENLALSYSTEGHLEDYLAAIRLCLANEPASEGRPECFPLAAGDFALEFRPHAQPPPSAKDAALRRETARPGLIGFAIRPARPLLVGAMPEGLAPEVGPASQR